MTSVTTSAMNEPVPDTGYQNSALIRALVRLAVPLARLCLECGITFPVVEDVLKRAFVQEAGILQPDAPAHGMVSRISTATGMNRREVTRLTKFAEDMRPAKPPLAAEVFARWTTDSAWRDNQGAPCTLNRQGAAPSFEALAQSITRD